MKKATWIIAGAALILPLISSANITVTAGAVDDSGYAYLYNYDTGLEVEGGSATFSGGSATINTAGLPTANYSIAVRYTATSSAFTDIAWSGLLGVTAFKNFGSGYSDTITAISGDISGRGIDSGLGRAGITLSGMSPLSAFNNDTNGLDAEMGIFRAPANQVEYEAGVLTRTLDLSSIGSGGLDIRDAGFADLVFVDVDVNGMANTYLADDKGGDQYDIFFYPEAYGYASDLGGVDTAGNDTTFFMDGVDTSGYGQGVAYYVMMNRAYMYDNDDNFSQTYDTQLDLLSPDYYAAIPEPATMMLVMGFGGGILFIRRFFSM